MESKTAFLLALAGNRHRDEATILCSCYIEWLGLGLYGANDNSSHFRYVRAIVEHGGEGLLSYIHPKMLRDGLSKLTGKTARAIIEKLSHMLTKPYGRVYSDEEFITIAMKTLTNPEADYLKKHLWKGTLAAVAYSIFRNSGVHAFGAPDSISFDNTYTLDGRPIPNITFDMLHIYLTRILTYAKEVSLRTGLWFGREDIF